MTDDNTGAAVRGGSVVEWLAPLAAAAPPTSSGRIRTLAEARNALRIPTSADADVLQAWGIPRDGWFVAYPVNDRDQPDLVAEFAALRVIRREGHTLRAVQPGTRLRMTAISNLLWVVHGSLVRAADQALVIGSLNIGPAFEGQLSRAGDDTAHGVTAQLLRLLTPARLIRETVDRLQRQRILLDRPHGPSMPPTQRDVYDTIAATRGRRERVSPELIAAIARRYLALYRDGNRRPLPQLAAEFGITREQARDRIHKARAQGYLTAGKQGRAGAEPGSCLND